MDNPAKYRTTIHRVRFATIKTTIGTRCTNHICFIALMYQHTLVSRSLLVHTGAFRRHIAGHFFRVVMAGALTIRYASRTYCSNAPDNPFARHDGVHTRMRNTGRAPLHRLAQTNPTSPQRTSTVWYMCARLYVFPNTSRQVLGRSRCPALNLCTPNASIKRPSNVMQHKPEAVAPSPVGNRTPKVCNPHISNNSDVRPQASERDQGQPVSPNPLGSRTRSLRQLLEHAL